MAGKIDAPKNMEGIGELSFPDENTVHLKPILLSKRQKLQCKRPVWSMLMPIPPILLWFTGVNLLLYPVWWILLGKYRQDFRDDWHEMVHDSSKEASSYTLLAQTSLSFLDGLAVWVIDMCPKMASAILLFHFGLCLAYLAFAIWKERREKPGGKGEKED